MQNEKPLYQHNSIDSAYLVPDYPWGFRLRTEKQYWIEYRESMGFRLCHRTKDPRNGKWCAVKNSTYMKFGACMFLDEQNHVQWTGVTEYSDAAEIKNFVARFPQAVQQILRDFVKARANYYRKLSEKSTDELKKESALKEAKEYEEIFVSDSDKKETESVIQQ